MRTCMWFLKCTNRAVRLRRAFFGEVPICDRCDKLMGADR